MALGGFAAIPRRAETASAGLIRDVEQKIPGAMKELNVPGVSVALVQNARVVWRCGFGVADAETGKPVDNDTLFQAASMSKPVFAYAVMKICEKGVLDLDTPLTRYVSERVLADDARLESITARHVLSHTSGFQNWRTGEKPLAIHFTPGQKYLYSGEGYWYLQSVISRLRGRVFEKECSRYEGDVKVCATDIADFMKVNVLAPLAMNSGGYVWNEKWRARAARGHDLRGHALPFGTPRPVDAARYASAGGLVTTPSEYARLLIAMMAPTASGLRNASVREMLRPQVQLESTGDVSIAWGLGWRLAHTKPGDLFGHGGDNAGFHCLAEGCVARKSGFVIMTNGDGGWKLLQRLAPAISERVHGFIEQAPAFGSAASASSNKRDN